MTIEQLTRNQARERVPELEALLNDAVSHGASVGFLHPLDADEASTYWEKVINELETNRVFLAAIDAGGRLIGGAQLALESRPNGRHRAEVQKLLVLSSGRRQGVGAALMRAIEAEAARRGRTLLFLDTSTGKGGATEFYLRLGYTLAGGIPDYAADPDGTLMPNAIFYKRLSQRSG